MPCPEMKSLSGEQIFGMLADDLTGAMDAGMQLLSTGQPVFVSLTADVARIQLPACGFLVVNAGSRNLPERDAREAVLLACARLKEQGARLMYKKIDSTLRGNLGAELDAILSIDARGFLVAPALPSGGRTTVDGVQYVNGRRLLENDLAKDPFSPLRHDHIAQIIGEQTGQKTYCVRLSALRSGRAGEMIQDAQRDGARIFVMDAETDEDLKFIAALAEDGRALIPCGSAGLIAALTDAGRAVPPIPKVIHRPVLTLCGSPAHICKTQLDRAAQMISSFALVRIDPVTASDSEKRDALDRVMKALAAGKHAALDAAADGKEALYTENNNLSLEKGRTAVQSLLNDAAKLAFSRQLPGALVLLGGDSAAGALAALGATQIELLAAAQPLMPCGRLADGQAKGALLVTKAGGFGDADSLIKILEAIT